MKIVLSRFIPEGEVERTIYTELILSYRKEGIFCDVFKGELVEGEETLYTFPHPLFYNYLSGKIINDGEVQEKLEEYDNPETEIVFNTTTKKSDD